MQIFVIHPNPVVCARYLDDRRVGKMCLESAQILSTAMHVQDYQRPYRTTHVHHPCVRWAMSSDSNWAWLYEYWYQLIIEWHLRFGRTHGTYTKCWYHFRQYRREMSDVELHTPTDWANGTPYHQWDTFTAYIKHLHGKFLTDKLPAKTTIGRRYVNES